MSLAWFQLAVAFLGVTVIPLGAWAFRLSLKCAELAGRITVLEKYRAEDVVALKELTHGVQNLLLSNARIEERLGPRKGTQ